MSKDGTKKELAVAEAAVKEQLDLANVDMALPHEMQLQVVVQERLGYLQGYLRLTYALKGLRSQGLDAEAESQFKRARSFISSVAAIDKDFPEAKEVMTQQLTKS